MTTITYDEFKTNLHVYLERVFRERAIIKVKDGQRSFVLLGESWPAQKSDNIERLGELTFMRRSKTRIRPFIHISRAPFASR